MAVELKYLTRLTLSGLEKHKSIHTIPRNLFRVSIWGALSSGAVALTFIFKRSLVQANSWRVSYIFNASLTSCGTFTFFAAFLGYKILQIYKVKDEEIEPAYKKLEAQVWSLEDVLVYTSAALSLIAIFGRNYLNPNQMIKSLAARSVVPLMWVEFTSAAIALFHTHQFKQKEIYDSII